MRFPFVFRGAPLLLALVLLPARPAAAAPELEARHSGPLVGFVLVTQGDTISHLGDCPPQEIPGKPWERPRRCSRVGYKYCYWGAFWLDLWTWGGEYCLYDGKMWVP